MQEFQINLQNAHERVKKYHLPVFKLIILFHTLTYFLY